MKRFLILTLTSLGALVFAAALGFAPTTAAPASHEALYKPMCSIEDIESGGGGIDGTPWNNGQDCPKEPPPGA